MTILSKVVAMRICRISEKEPGVTGNKIIQNIKTYETCPWQAYADHVKNMMMSRKGAASNYTTNINIWQHMAIDKSIRKIENLINTSQKKRRGRPAFCRQSQRGAGAPWGIYAFVRCLYVRVFIIPFHQEGPIPGHRIADFVYNLMPLPVYIRFNT